MGKFKISLFSRFLSFATCLLLLFFTRNVIQNELSERDRKELDHHSQSVEELVQTKMTGLSLLMNSSLSQFDKISSIDYFSLGIDKLLHINTKGEIQSIFKANEVQNQNAYTADFPRINKQEYLRALTRVLESKGSELVKINESESLILKGDHTGVLVGKVNFSKWFKNVSHEGISFITNLYIFNQKITYSMYEDSFDRAVAYYNERDGMISGGELITSTYLMPSLYYYGISIVDMTFFVLSLTLMLLHSFVKEGDRVAGISRELTAGDNVSIEMNKTVEESEVEDLDMILDEDPSMSSEELEKDLELAYLAGHERKTAFFIHNMNNLMTVVSMGLDTVKLILNKDGMDPEVQKQKINATVDSMSSRLEETDSILNLGRMDGDPQEIDSREEVSLERICGHIFRELSSKYPGIEFTSELELESFSSDSEIIFQVLNHLIEHVSHGVFESDKEVKFVKVISSWDDEKGPIVRVSSSCDEKGSVSELLSYSYWAEHQDGDSDVLDFALPFAKTTMKKLGGSFELKEDESDYILNFPKVS